MRIRRLFASVLLVALMLTCFSVRITAASSLTVSLDSDQASGKALAKDETVTYTLTITENHGGFVAGTFFFRPSENLTYLSATLLGDEYTAEKAVSGENEGAYGIFFVYDAPYTESGVAYCTITFRMKEAGVPSVDFYAYQLIGGDPAAGTTEPVTLTTVGNALPKKLTPIDGSSYRLSDGYLHGVVALTTRTALLAQFEQKEKIKVYAADGTEITKDDTLVGTGCQVKLMNGNTVLDSATVVVLGDTSGDGRIGTLDYQRIRSYYLGNYTLKDAYLLAARVTGRETIGTLDYQRVRAHYLGNYNLYA